MGTLRFYTPTKGRLKELLGGRGRDTKVHGLRNQGISHNSSLGNSRSLVFGVEGEMSGTWGDPEEAKRNARLTLEGGNEKINPLAKPGER